MPEQTSFNTSVKSEILSRGVRTNSLYMPFLAGLFRACGTLTLHREHGVGARFSSESEALVTAFSDMCSSAFSGAQDTMTLRGVSTMGNEIYSAAFFGEPARTLLIHCGSVSADEPSLPGGTPIATVSNYRKKRAFLAGVFLGCGYVGDPESAYQLEMICRSEGLCNDIVALTGELGINFRTTYRRKDAVAYIKDAESIASFLALTGAQEAVLDLENVRIKKEIRNYANRTTNCDISNIAKTNAASREQRDAIELLMNRGEMGRLSQAQIEMAQIRLSNPEASITELASLLNISRSGAYNRLRGIMSAADELRQAEDAQGGDA